MEVIGRSGIKKASDLLRPQASAQQPQQQMQPKQASLGSQFDSLQQNADVFTDFAKSAESKYGFDMNQYLPGHHATGKKPTPTSQQFYDMWDTYTYNNLYRKQQKGLSALDFGTPDYNPYNHSDDDNEVWGDFYSKYSRLPSQQEFETNKSAYVQGKKDTASKKTATLLGTTWKSGEDFTNYKNDYWQQLGYGYDTASVDDLNRQQLGLPPKAYLDKYSKSDEDQRRLASGEIPTYYDNTTKALAEMKDFQGVVMQAANEGKVHNADDVAKLFDPQKYQYLDSIDQYIADYNTAKNNGAKYTSYDVITGKSPTLPWQHVDMDMLKKNGYGVSTGVNGILTSDYFKNLADSVTKMNSNSNVYGKLEAPPANAQAIIRQAADAGRPYSTQTQAGPGFGQVASAAWKEGASNTQAGFSRTLTDIASVGQKDPFEQLKYIAANTDAYSQAAYQKMDPRDTVKKYIDQGYSLYDIAGWKGVNDAVDRSGGITSVAVALENPSIDKTSPGVSDADRLRNFSDLLNMYGIVGAGVANAANTADLTDIAQEAARARQTNDKTLQFVGDVVAGIPSVAGGAAASAVSPAAGAAFWASLGYGQSAEEARLEGATPEQQKIYGAVGAVGNAAIGMLQGQIFKGTLIKLGAKAAAKSLTATGLKMLLNAGILTSATAVQQIAMNAVKKGIFSPDTKIIDGDQLLSGAETTVATSFLLSIFGLPFESNAKKYVVETANAGESVDVAKAEALLREESKDHPEVSDILKPMDKMKADTTAAVDKTATAESVPAETPAASSAGMSKEDVADVLKRIKDGTYKNWDKTDTSATSAAEDAAASKETSTAKVTGTDVFTPEKVVDIPGTDLVQTVGDLNEMSQHILDSISENPEYVKVAEKEYAALRTTLNSEIESTIKLMNENGGKGVRIINDWETGKALRESDNEKWYRELYKETGKKPTQARLKSAAIEFMLNDNNELHNPDFASKFRIYEQMKPLMDKIEKGGDILSVDKLDDGSYKVTYGQAGEAAPEPAPKPKSAKTDSSTVGAEQRAAAALRDRLRGGNEEHFDFSKAPVRYKYRSLIDDFLGVKGEARKLETPKAKIISAEAQKMADELVAKLDEVSGRIGMSETSWKQLESVHKGFSKKLAGLISDLQAETIAAQEKAKSDLKALRETKNAKLATAEKKRQADVLATKVKLTQKMRDKLAVAETKRRMDLADLRDAKNASFEWKKTGSALKDLRKQFDGGEKRPVPEQYRGFMDETLKSLEQKGPGGRANGTVNVDKFDTWLRGLDDSAMAEAGMDVQDRQRVQGWIDEVRGKAVRDMTADEHQALGKLVRRIAHLSDSYYHFFGHEKHLQMQAVRDQAVEMINKTVKDASEKAQDLPSGGGGLLRKSIDRYWGNASLKPYTAAKWLLHDTADSAPMRIINDDLRQADHDGVDMNMKDLAAKKEIFAGAKQTTWSGKDSLKTEFTLENGQKVGLTKSEQVFMWLNSKNDFNVEAMQNGVEFKTTGAEFTPSTADIEQIAQHVESTPALYDVGRRILEKFNGEFKVRANSTSRQLYGYDIASVENYVPVERSGAARSTNFQTISKTLESYSWTKQRTGSSAPVMGWDIFDMYDRMALESAQYAAYSVPVKNAQRLLGNGPVREAIIQKRGQLAFDYWKRLLGDVAERGQQTPDVTGNVLDTARRNAQAAIMSSPWVMANQYAQVPAIFAYIDPKYAPRAFKLRMPAEDLAAMKQYAPELYARRIFGGMTEAAEMKNVVGDAPSVTQRIRELASKGVGINDTVTMNFTWEAAKAQIKAENPGLTGDAFWGKVGELTSRAVEETQPSHGLFTRSLFENTKTPLERLLFMFSGGPNAVWNMGADAIAEIRWGGKAGKAKAGRLIGGIVVSQVVFGALSALRQAVTNQDFSKIGQQTAQQTLLAFLTTPYGLNIPVSYLQGFETRLQGLDQIQKLTTGISGLFTMQPVEYAKTDTPAQKSAKDAAHTASVVGKWKDILTQVTSICGIPAYQLERDIIKPALKIADEKAYNDYLAFFGDKQTYSKDFQAAVQSGNKDKARSILQDQVDAKGTDAVEESWHSAGWYKALSPADKAFWDGVLTRMRQRK